MIDDFLQSPYAENLSNLPAEEALDEIERQTTTGNQWVAKWQVKKGNTSEASFELSNPTQAKKDASFRFYENGIRGFHDLSPDNRLAQEQVEKFAEVLVKFDECLRSWKCRKHEWANGDILAAAKNTAQKILGLI